MSGESLTRVNISKYPVLPGFTRPHSTTAPKRHNRFLSVDKSNGTNMHRNHSDAMYVPQNKKKETLRPPTDWSFRHSRQTAMSANFDTLNLFDDRWQSRA
jgi:hypothetical protein